jgi:hypothetical protein
MTPRLFASFLCLTLLAGCVAPEAIDQCDAQARLCHDDALDPALPLEARQAEADNCRAWCQQRETLTGHPVPAAATWAPLPPELDPPSSPAPAGGGR